MASSNNRNVPLLNVHAGPSASALHVHPSTARRLQLAPGSSTVVVCGHRQVNVTVAHDSRTRESTFALPNDALRRLGLASPIATRLRFRVKRTDDCVELGPVIGILAHVTPHAKPRARDHGYPIIHAVWNIENLGGLVYFFSPEGINWDSGTVRGFVHVPGKVEWKAGEFPFPQAIYRRIAVPSKMEQEMQRLMTPHAFNTVRLGNKLVQFQLMSDDPYLHRHLPETRALVSAADFEAIVGRYGRAFIKNTGKGAGAGVFRVEPRRRGGWRVRLQERHRKRGARDGTAVVADFRKLMKLATKQVGRPWNPERWLVQQPLTLARYRGRPFDVRVNVQKDGWGRWCIAGHVVRIAPDKDAAVTRRGDYRSLEPVFRHVWPRRFQSIVREIDALSIEACRFLEAKLGLLGDVGVDIAVDERGKPWFLEANPRPCHSLRTVDDLEQQFWPKVFRPLVYAAHLSGFSLSSDDISWPKRPS